MSDKKVVLAILDGWGLGKNPEISAIAKAKTPFIDECIASQPNSQLEASGLSVGLPDGQMGNSEVGHMNLGAGRVVYQNLVKINLAVQNETLAKEKTIQEAFEYAKNSNKKMHFIGLVSDGGVHSHSNHLKALLTAAARFQLKNVFVHAFTDGRDCDPQSGADFITQLQEHCRKTTGKVASVIGRYYAMDRDKRWERVKKAYDVMLNGLGIVTSDFSASIRESYRNLVTDEFLEPLVSEDFFSENQKIEQGDVVFCFNFRTDRGREISEVLTQKDFPDFGMKKLELYYVTLTNYDKTYRHVKVVFDENSIENTLGKVLENHHKTQIRIAETEKYPHVTFFFSGGQETQFRGEKRLLCNSPKDVATYDLKPEMAAYDIKNSILPEIKNQSADFICLNFANADMVGHTGSMEAAIKACEIVDACIKEVAEVALENDYCVFILADHGNSDVMKNDDGSPNTQHSTNLVPFVVLDKNKKWIVRNGKLGDIAPSLLSVMNIPIPAEMTGNIIVN